MKRLCSSLSLFTVLLVIGAPVAATQSIEPSAWFRAESLQSAQFALSVAMSEDFGVIGEVGASQGALGSGAVAVVLRDQEGMHLDFRLAPETSVASSVGRDVDIGDGLVVTCTTQFGEQTPSGPIGRAYVYDRVGDAFALSGVLDCPDPSAVSGFGWAVAVIDHDAVVVSRPADYSTPGTSGSLYLYERGASGWEFTEKYPLPVQLPAVLGGTALDYDNGFLIVARDGAYASIYERDAGGRFHFLQEFIEPNLNTSDAFGSGVALEGDLLAIGNPQTTNPTKFGVVYVFRHVAGQWIREDVLHASDAFVRAFSACGCRQNTGFGRSVDIQGGRIIVGAPSSPRGITPTAFDQLLGAAYVFERQAGEWVETTRLYANPVMVGDLFGVSAAIHGDGALVGGPFVRVSGFPTGAAYAFELPFGETVCSGQPNSTGQGSELVLTGNRLASMMDLRVSVSELPSQATCLLLASTSTGFVANPAGSQGNLCLSGQISRFVQLAGTSSSTGHYVVDLDTTEIPTPQMGPQTIQAGDTYVFQLWHRDANPLPTSNFSAARSVTFR